MAVSASTIRNVALLSHSGAGKTTLVETMLFNAQVINRLGRVEDGTTVSDYEPEENRRSSSVQTSLLRLDDGDSKINMLDTPGYDEFLGEAVAAVRVVESAVIVVAAPTGVDVGTERGWNMAQERGLAVAFVLNKMDRENASFERSVQELQDIFGTRCVPFQLPVGEAQDFTGLVSVIDPPADMPAGVIGDFDTARERLIEAVAESDDELADKYLEGEDITAAEVTAGARKAIISGDLIPILVTSATQDIGVNELVQVMRDFLPSPADSPQTSGDDDMAPDSAGPAAAVVFKTTSDAFVGKLSMFPRVPRVDEVQRRYLQRQPQPVRAAGPALLAAGQQPGKRGRGGGRRHCRRRQAGLHPDGNTLCASDARVTLPGIEFPKGFYSLAVVPATQADLDKMSTSLARIVEDDPSLQFTRNPETSESLLTGLGEVQIEVALDRIKRKFGTSLKRQAARRTLPGGRSRRSPIPNTATRSRPAAAANTATSCSGWSPRSETKASNSATRSWEDVCRRGKLIPAVEKGVVSMLKEGVLAGFPVVDLKAVLYDGSTHPVDGKPIAFEIAGSQALRQGMTKAVASPAGAHREVVRSRCRRTIPGTSSATSTASAAAFWAWFRRLATPSSRPRCRSPRCSGTLRTCVP